MEGITWKYIEVLDNPNNVVLFLRKYGISIPSDLIKFLENNNGGMPSKPVFSTEKKEGYVLKNLLSFNENSCESIHKFYPALFLGSYLFPFALDVTGNFICYDLQNNKYVLWKHETDKVENIKFLI